MHCGFCSLLTAASQMSTQPARDANGDLLPTEKITFYQSESDETPISSTKEPRRSTRARQTDKLAESLTAEKQDEDGNPIPAKVRTVEKATRGPFKAVFSSISPIASNMAYAEHGVLHCLVARHAFQMATCSLDRVRPQNLATGAGKTEPRVGETVPYFQFLLLYNPVL
ncbi:hypothetical protein B0H11DRAFT_1990130, partial [Mycena galericulata]